MNLILLKIEQMKEKGLKYGQSIPLFYVTNWLVERVGKGIDKCVFSNMWS